MRIKMYNKVMLRGTKSSFCAHALFALRVLAAICVVCLCALISACTQQESTSGSSFTLQTRIIDATYDESAALGENNAYIDTSHVAQGYVGASCINDARIKLQVTSGNTSYNYNVSGDGTPTIAPLTFGDGTYTFRLMQNTSENNYVELYQTSANVVLDDENSPYVRPNIFCNYTENSECVSRARELVSSCATQGEAVEAICSWVIDNISYDDEKALELQSATDYVPNPDATIESGTGICFDYASLGAAMLRSQGIPTQIVTGYVSPNGIYHAWIMIYIDGTWTTAQFSVEENTWSRVDLTFAAGSSNANIGDGKEYTDRYVY